MTLSAFLRDYLYIALGEQREVAGESRWVFRVYYNPFVDVLYLGTILVGIGGLLAMWPSRREGSRPVAGEASP